MERIAIIGLGYVGLPLALSLAERHNVIGYDIDPKRIRKLISHFDSNGEMPQSAFEGKDITFTTDPELIHAATCYIVAVPTGLTQELSPDLSTLISATQIVGKSLNVGDIVIYESTVYPGCTEEECLPLLEKESGLERKKDFMLGYSPERMVPGDTNHQLSQITKLISGYDTKSLNRVKTIYDSIDGLKLHLTSSIKIAEAAKILENTQRDINISLMNEMSVILHKLDISTSEVIEAASTKWNFHPYRPGLVGGHCISVDPMYLIHKAAQVGHIPQVVAAGRRVNDYIPHFIARTLLQKILNKDISPLQARILLLGITFKENVSDIRNSRVIHLYQELLDYRMSVDVIDPNVTNHSIEEYNNIQLIAEPQGRYHAIILAVNHSCFASIDEDFIRRYSYDLPIFFDVKSVRPALDQQDVDYWAL